MKIAPNGGIRPQTNPTIERSTGDVLLRLPKNSRQEHKLLLVQKRIGQQMLH